MPEVRADLTLDASSAEAEIQGLGDSLSSALDDAIANLQSNLADAFSGISGDTAGAAVDIPVTADTSEAVAAIEALPSDAPPVDIPVTADTTEAVTNIEDLSGAGSDVAGSLDSASGSASNFGGATAAAGALASAAEGSIGGVTDAASSLTPALAGAAGGALALGAGVTELFTQGVSTESALQRLSTTTGTFKADVENVNVGDLNTSLTTLGSKLGETSTSMINTATNAFQFAQASGEGGQKAAQFSNEIVALSARAVALNPQLGSVADVAQTLETRFATGRGSLAAYGIDLKTTDVNALALAETGKSLATELTRGEKAVAAADLATNKYGNTIKESVDNASKNAEIQVRQLRAGFEDFIGTLGKPLVAPVLDTLKALIPIGEQAATIVSQIAVAALPSLTAAANVVAPALGAVSSIIGAIPQPILDIGVAAGIGAIAWSKYGDSLLNVVPRFLALGGSIAGPEAGLAGLSGTLAAFGPIGAGIAVTVGALTAGYFTWSNSTSAVDDATANLDSAISSKHVPAIQAAFGAVERATQAHQSSTSAMNEELRTTNSLVVGTTATTQGVESYNAAQKNGEIAQTAFNKALKESPEAAQAALTAYNNVGVGTQHMQEQLNQAEAASKKLATAQAQVQVATDPLAASFQKSAVAAGAATQQSFELANVQGQEVDSAAKAAQAHDAYSKAVASGNIVVAQQAAVAEATSKSQGAFNTALLQGASNADAAKLGTATYRDSLDQLRNSASGPVKDALSALIGQIDQYNATHPEPKVLTATDQVTSTAAAAQKAIDDLKQGKPPDVIINDLASAQSQIAQLAIDAIKQGAPPEVVLKDLASGNARAIQALIDGIQSKTVTVTVNQVVNQVQGALFPFAEGGRIEAAASGANVGKVGQPILVGEEGPELFVPNQTGTIVPNNKLGAGGDSGTLERAALRLHDAASAIDDAGGLRIVIVRNWDEAVQQMPALGRADPSFVMGRS